MTLKVHMNQFFQVGVLLTLALVLCAPMTSQAAIEKGAEKNKEYHIRKIQWEKTDHNLLRIQGETSPVFTVYELFNPARLVIDIADGILSESAGLPLEFTEGPVSLVKGNVIDGQVPKIAQLQLLFAENRDYSVVRDENDIVVQFGQLKEENDSQPQKLRVIRNIAVEATALETRLHIQADGPIKEFTTTRLAKSMGHPHRLLLDLPDMEMEKTEFKVIDSPLGGVRTEMLDISSGVRLVLDSTLDTLFDYDIEQNENGLDVIIQASPKKDTDPVSALVATGLVVPEQKQASISKDRKKQPVLKPVPGKKSAQKATVSSSSGKQRKSSEFSVFAGYNAQKISVDFFKIDLHNVFRLIGEISKRNIVVDEAVNGSLTLALNDVPWDFALNIILNLKNLQKEERFNTIVISPKDKKFTWPQSASANLKIEMDKDPLKVRKRLDVPKETFEAKRLIRQGVDLEKAKDYQGAVALYEKAMVLWPENSKLAEQIASLSLSRLGLNAQAAHYAQKALKFDPDNAKAALTAAVSLANLEKVQEAKGYFDIAVNTHNPSKQALASYASFCEQNESYEEAVNLLQRYEQIFGSSLQIMISKARLYDKLGQKDFADAEYRSALYSGDAIPDNLKGYIRNRLGL
jgi:type IV pilus assembly protein PilQ